MSEMKQRKPKITFTPEQRLEYAKLKEEYWTLIILSSLSHL
jgi:hypothetical protein